MSEVKRFTVTVHQNELKAGIQSTGLYDSTSPQWGFRYRVPSTPRHYVDVNISKAEHKAKRERARVAKLHAAIQSAALHHSRPIVLRKSDGTIAEPTRNGRPVSGVQYDAARGAILAPAVKPEPYAISRKATELSAAERDKAREPRIVPNVTHYRPRVK